MIEEKTLELQDIRNKLSAIVNVIDLGVKCDEKQLTLAKESINYLAQTEIYKL